MDDQVWMLGQTYRDSTTKNKDQLQEWVRTEHGTIANMGGIRALRYADGVEAPSPAAAAFVFWNTVGSKDGSRWGNEFPDFEAGIAKYWGDAKVESIGSAPRGNRLLQTIWDAQVAGGPTAATPLLLFQRPAKGLVKFWGLAVLEGLEPAQHVQSGGATVSNLVATLRILPAESVHASWLRRRVADGPKEADSALAELPEWTSELQGEARRLSLPKAVIRVRDLVPIPTTAVEAFALMTPGDVVAAIHRIDAGESGRFGPSTKYDLAYDGRLYAPKEVAGLACKRLLGRDAEASEFSGGENSACFRGLRRLGFQVVPRASDMGTTEAPQEGILLTWNQSRWPWTDLRAHIDSVRDGRQPTGIGGERWSTGNRREGIPKGTPFYMIKLGNSPKGIIGRGRTASGVYQADHFDEDRRLAGDQANYVDLEWEVLVDPHTDGLLDVWSLGEPVLSRYHWSPQGSAQGIQVAVMRALEPHWQDFLERVGVERDVVPEPDVGQPYDLATAAEDLFLDAADVQDMVASLGYSLNIVLQGPPGVGKTYVAKRLAYLLMKERDESRVEMIQFHQAYAYEDFMQGFRPTEGGGFKRRDGVFFRFCQRAAADVLGRPWVFIIDEINRGNLAAIFGELMMLIEADKRGPEFEVPLTYSEEGERFFVPENVHVIGLMNTADRSLAIVDYALRRRFRFFDVPPQFNSRFLDHLERRGVSRQFAEKLATRVRELNLQIREDKQNLGRGFEIGHSYFTPLVPITDAFQSEEDWLRSVVERDIRLLLDEYWGFDDPDRVEAAVSGLLP